MKSVGCNNSEEGLVPIGETEGSGWKVCAAF